MYSMLKCGMTSNKVSGQAPEMSGKDDFKHAPDKRRMKKDGVSVLLEATKIAVN